MSEEQLTNEEELEEKGFNAAVDSLVPDAPENPLDARDCGGRNGVGDCCM